jgi:hypothetical protein
MSPDERKSIAQLRKSFEDYKRSQFDIDAGINSKLEQILRGLYGDDRNGQKGLIQRQSEDEGRFSIVEEQFEQVDKRLTQVENKQYRQFVWLAGILAALQVVWNLIKEKLF